jgi:hypothetical protein
MPAREISVANASVRLELGTTSLARVRARVRALLAGYTGLVVEDAVQITDQLVTNAHQHGQPPRTCRLALLDRGRRLRIEVDDASPAEPVPRTPDRFGGLGLILIQRLASAWGVFHHAGHKIVWAELALTGRRTNCHLASAPGVTVSRRTVWRPGR